MNSLVGRTVVVTGAASGVGAAVARACRDAGASVVAADLTATDGVRHLDVTDEAAWARLAADLGEVHGLVQAAGTTWRARVGEVAAADFRRVMDTNALGPLLGIQAMLPRFAAGASVVLIGSLAARTGHYPVAYTASKWALRGVAAAAALELGPRGIRVNTIHPGFVETPMTASASPAFRTASIAAAPLGRPGKPDDVAAAALYLLSDAAAFVTGAELDVDGGAASHAGAKSVSDALRTSTT